MRVSAEELWERYHRSLYAAAFSMCRNPQDAEDAVQDTLLRYLLRTEEYESEEHLRAWLLRVAINQAKNKAHSFFRRNTVPLEEYMETLTFPTPGDGELFSAVLALPEKLRVVIHLYYYEDYSVQEIAEILHLTPSNVKTRLSRGRDALRRTCKEVWEDDEQG